MVVGSLIFSCSGEPKEQESVQESAKGEAITSIQPEITGSILAKSYCSECHQFPTPELLDKSSWEKYVLPRMGNYFGIYHADYPRERIMGGGRAGQIVEEMNVFPVSRTLDTAVFNQIKKYYQSNFPARPQKTLPWA